MGDTNGSRIIKGPDGIRTGVAIHGYDPRFSAGCFTTFETGKNGGIPDLINAIPDLKDDTQPVRLIVEPRNAKEVERNNQTMWIGF